jgi:hypothetical protein
MTACQEGTETEPDPGMMQSTEEHQEIPNGEAAVMPVGEPRKRCSIRNLAAERRQKWKERTWGNHGARRKSAAACRKVSRRAKVAWRKRNHIMRIETKINYGPQKRLTVTCRKTTSRETVGWHSENVVRNDRTRDQAERGTPKRRKGGEGLWKFPECNNGISDQGIKQKLHSRKQIKDLGERLPLCPRNKRTFSGIYRKPTGLEIAKQIARCTVGLKRIKDWALWRGRPPPKRKRELAGTHCKHSPQKK